MVKFAHTRLDVNRSTQQKSHGHHLRAIYRAALSNERSPQSDVATAEFVLQVVTHVEEEGDHLRLWAPGD